MVENVHRYRSVLIGLVFVVASVLQIIFYTFIYHGTEHLAIDNKRSYSEQLAEARELVKELEELEKLERMDPNDPRLDSVAAAMKLNLAEMQKHQEAKGQNDTNSQPYDYSQKKYYPNILGAPHVCRNMTDGSLDNVYLLIAIKSMTGSFSRRKAIRDTWANTDKIPVIGQKVIVRRIFLLGKSDPSVTDNDKREALLKEEAREWGDILQGDFQDSFRNLTLKEIMFLRWIPHFCPHTKFIFKGDDDIFANIPNIVQYIQSMPLSQQRDLFVGSVLYPSPRITEPRSKYYVSENLWPEKYYPPYVSGGGFIMSSVMAARIFEAMKELPIIPIDDAFIGVCLRKLNLRPTNHKGFKSWGVKYLEHDNCVWREVMTFHKLQPEELQQVWLRFVASENDEKCARHESDVL